MWLSDIFLNSASLFYWKYNIFFVLFTGFNIKFSGFVSEADISSVLTSKFSIFEWHLLSLFFIEVRTFAWPHFSPISTCGDLQTPDRHLFILSVTSSFWPQSFTLHYFLAFEKKQNLRILRPDRLSARHSRFHPAAQRSSGEFKSLSELTEWIYRCGQTVTGVPGWRGRPLSLS